MINHKIFDPNHAYFLYCIGFGCSWTLSCNFERLNLIKSLFTSTLSPQFALINYHYPQNQNKLLKLLWKILSFWWNIHFFLKSAANSISLSALCFPLSHQILSKPWDAYFSPRVCYKTMPLQCVGGCFYYPAPLYPETPLFNQLFQKG